MKSFSVSLCLLVLTASLPANAERAFVADRKPIPSIDEAIKLVREYDAKTPNAKPIFVDHAKFERSPNGSHWKIGVRYEENETGQMIYSVNRKGEVKMEEVIKDG